MFFKKRPKPSAPIQHATDDDFAELVEERVGVTVVDFWAPWCGPCRLMAPILDEIALDYADEGVAVVKVNTDEAQRSSERFGIRSIPTLIFFKDGEPLFEMVGAVPKPVLEREINLLL
ncbi:MAG: thioredoxin [Gemmatimonadetes bacterium]|nr:thioredoxin [Gemmatimonadota bacterium]